ncbi:MAG: hydroxyacylglutathione hydrolase [Betaproteobacteria bacterium]|nr:MAG: hydroxyacylglutathione hydrolase [Betaproteobacteria bacterium]
MDIVPIPAFADNYIWMLVDSATADPSGPRACVVVDPGDAAPVEATLLRENLTLNAILITHHHADHTGGIAALTQHRNIPVYGPATEAIAGVTHALVEGDEVSLDSVRAKPGEVCKLRVMEIPGHTRGHIAYVGDGFVLCGDTLFAAGCGRLFEGTPAQMHASLQRLAALPPETLVYCTHEYTLSNLKFALSVEPDNDALVTRSFDDRATRGQGAPTVPSTIARELATNPFLRCDQSGIRAQAERHAGTSLHNVVDVFASIRAQKDVFR